MGFFLTHCHNAPLGLPMTGYLVLIHQIQSYLSITCFFSKFYMQSTYPHVHVHHSLEMRIGAELIRIHRHECALNVYKRNYNHVQYILE